MRHIFRFLFKYILLPIIFLFLAFYFWGSSGSLDRNQMADIINYKYVSIQPQDTFSIMTYNIGYLSGMTNNLPFLPDEKLHRENRKKVIQLFQQLQPDFAGFQEIDFNSSRSFNINQMDTLAKYTPYPYGAYTINWDKRYVPFPYWPPTVHFGGMLSGQAILSKYAFVNNKRLVLEKPEEAAFWYNAFYLDRLIQIVQVDLGRPLIIMNVHLEAFYRGTREKQAQALLDTFKDYANNYPVLLIGDFNSRPFFDRDETDPESTIQLFVDEPGIDIAIPDSLYNSNPRIFYTYPTDTPIEKLDYIFYTSDKIRPVEAWIVREAGTISDHLPVYMKFVFTR